MNPRRNIFPRGVYPFFAILMLFGFSSAASAADFEQGRRAYEASDFELAAQHFARVISNEPSVGALQNLGNAQWQLGRTAEALIAWEQALSLAPFTAAVEENLKFARETAQLETPDLTWCEIAAGWLPANWWARLACGSLWFAVAMMLLPGVLRWRRVALQQALVAVGLGIFLLTLPANYGCWTRMELGFVMEAETPLRYTPTKNAEPVTRMAAGEPGRILRQRGNYLLIQTRRNEGWVERDKFRRMNNI